MDDCLTDWETEWLKDWLAYWPYAQPHEGAKRMSVWVTYWMTGWANEMKWNEWVDNFMNESVYWITQKRVKKKWKGKNGLCWLID